MRILIVDDDTAIIEVIRDTVDWDKLGIDEIDVAYDAQGARESLTDKAADIVISDIEMPGESGLDLLKWFRDEEMPGKFLLLTSHENFQYATQAIRYHAEEYLMKPFNLDVVEMTLWKIAGEIRKEWQEHRLTYEEWAERNRREIKRTFWFNLFSGGTMHTKREIGRELERIGLAMDQDTEYRLVVSRVTNMEGDMEMYGRELVMFMLENMHSELLRGVPDSEDIISFEHREYGNFVVICEWTQADALKERCGELIRKIENLLECTLTCCICRPCTMDGFYEAYHAAGDLLSRNIVYYGEAFYEEQAVEMERMKLRCNGQKAALARKLDGLEVQVRALEAERESVTGDRLRRLSLEKEATRLRRELMKGRENQFFDAMRLDLELEEQIKKFVEQEKLTAKVTREFVVEVRGGT